MQSEIVFGNAQAEGENRWGWFIGHFITPTDDPRSIADLEIKWGNHQAGESRSEWSKNDRATSLSILIAGKFRIQFLDREFLLSTQGDYVLWCPGVPHCWVAEENSTILTVRWPSLPGDSKAVTQKLETGD